MPQCPDRMHCALPHCWSAVCVACYACRDPIGRGTVWEPSGHCLGTVVSARGRSVPQVVLLSEIFKRSLHTTTGIVFRQCYENQGRRILDRRIQVWRRHFDVLEKYIVGWACRVTSLLISQTGIVGGGRRDQLRNPFMTGNQEKKEERRRNTS